MTKGVAMTREKNMNVEELFGKDYTEFSETDPFNPGNVVSGFISRRATEYYGALLITSVNGEPTEQLIMATPKMHYPFSVRNDGTRKYDFPVAKSVEIYEKLDGTNILAFCYQHGGQDFYSFKTRLRPFLMAGRFGDFLSMWNEVGIKYQDEIRRLMAENNCNLSFELYGARNPVLVCYPDIPLAIALLFGVTNAGNILSPVDLEETGLPVVTSYGVVTSDLSQNYEAIQKRLQETLKQTEDGYYTGAEGTVWYLKTPDGRCIQFKCKPETIEAIHFSAGAGIGRNVIITTCWNAYENVDTLTVDFVKQLLQEEFDAVKIEANHYLIEKCVAFVEGEKEFRRQVLTEYKASGLNILADKGGVMRLMSTKFAKKDMRKVYGIITVFG